MKRFFPGVLLALLVAGSYVPAHAQSAAVPSVASESTVVPSDATTKAAASSDLFKRMTQVNARLKTYKADLHIDVALKSFLPLNQSLDGNLYYKQPDREAVVFAVVPALAGPFKKLYAHIEPPALWPQIYTFAVLAEKDGVTTFRLVPRKHGRVAHLDVKVDNTTATIHGYVWTYEDGGFIAFDQSFTLIDGNYLVQAQSGDVELPSYKAAVHSSLSNYRLNVVLDDSVFQQQ
jgi:hypothetical protein